MKQQEQVRNDGVRTSGKLVTDTRHQIIPRFIEWALLNTKHTSTLQNWTGTVTCRLNQILFSISAQIEFYSFIYSHLSSRILFSKKHLYTQNRQTRSGQMAEEFITFLLQKKFLLLLKNYSLQLFYVFLCGSSAQLNFGLMVSEKLGVKENNKSNGIKTPRSEGK